MENITFLNVIIAFVGWLAWVVILLRIDKDEFDDAGKEFSFAEYWKRNWDNWLSTLIGVPIILIGADLLDVVKVFHDTQITWSNGFYLGAGIVIEAPMYVIKKWIKKKKLEE